MGEDRDPVSSVSDPERRACHRDEEQSFSYSAKARRGHDPGDRSPLATTHEPHGEPGTRLRCPSGPGHVPSRWSSDGLLTRRTHQVRIEKTAEAASDYGAQAPSPAVIRAESV